MEPTKKTTPNETNELQVGRLDYNMAKFNLRCLEKLFNLRTLEKEERALFLFIFYNCAKVVYGKTEAEKQTMEWNEKMEQPLSRSVVRAIIYAIDSHIEYSGLHASGFYRFGPRRIMHEKWLSVTEEEEDLCGFLAGIKRKEGFARRRELSRERDRLIAELYLKQGFGAKKIAKLLPEHLKCEPGTVRNTLRRLEIDGYRGDVEKMQGLDFEAHKRYQHQSKKKSEEK